MNYSDEVPTVSGYYWVKRNNKQEIKFIDVNALNKHWKIRKETFLSYSKNELELGEITVEIYNHYTNLPDSHWVIEYYGPLLPPQN